eukprot:s128_g14.t1
MNHYESEVWVSSDLADPSAPDPVKNREPCMTSSRIMSMALAFFQRGGLCDPIPGRNAFEFAVQKDRIRPLDQFGSPGIRSSGMMLRVVATSLKTGQAKWWDENSDTIIQGCEASGAIAPIIYPMEVDHEAFVDGGFVANTPIMKALQDGAQTVLVVNLDPLSTSGLISDLQALQKADTNVGLRIMQSEFNIMQQRRKTRNEVAADTAQMRDKGVQTVNETEPVDLCELFFKHYSTEKPNKEERAALAGRPPPVVYTARLRGALAKHHASTSSTSQSAPSLQQWMDVRFTTCCFLLGLLAGLSLKRSCVRPSLLPEDPELDAVTALCARAKGRSLGIIPSSPKRSKGSTPKKENDTVRIAGMNIPVAKASGGLRATNRGEPMDPQQVQKYLTSSFKENLQATRSAMEVAARRRSAQVLRSDCLSIYEKFRPEWKGWGVKGELSLKAARQKSNNSMEALRLNLAQSGHAWPVGCAVEVLLPPGVLLSRWSCQSGRLVNYDPDANCLEVCFTDGSTHTVPVNRARRLPMGSPTANSSGVTRQKDL